MKNRTKQGLFLAMAAAGLLAVGCRDREEHGMDRTPRGLPEEASTLPPQAIAARRMTPRIVTGTAIMRKDRTLVFLLRAQDESGHFGYARRTYPRSHPKYGKLLVLLGPMKPGDRKPLSHRPKAAAAPVDDSQLKTIAITP
jgi:hypothetical protein